MLGIQDEGFLPLQARLGELEGGSLDVGFAALCICHFPLASWKGRFGQ